MWTKGVIISEILRMNISDRYFARIIRSCCNQQASETKYKNSGCRASLHEENLEKFKFRQMYWLLP